MSRSAIAPGPCARSKDGGSFLTREGGMPGPFAALQGLRGHRPPRRRRLSFSLEWLEERRLLSARPDPGGVWTVRGTRADDTIIIDRNPGNTQDLRVFLDGTLVGERPAGQVKEI